MKGWQIDGVGPDWRIAKLNCCMTGIYFFSYVGYWKFTSALCLVL